MPTMPTPLLDVDLETVTGGSDFAGYPMLVAKGQTAAHIMSNPDMRFTVTPLPGAFSRIDRDR
jgi:hypothetical protein